MNHTKKEEVYQSMISVLKTYGVPLDIIAPSARLSYDLGLDSLDVSNIIVTIEKRLDIDIPDEEINDLQTVNGMLLCLQYNLVRQRNQLLEETIHRTS